MIQYIDLIVQELSEIGINPQESTLIEYGFTKIDTYYRKHYEKHLMKYRQEGDHYHLTSIQSHSKGLISGHPLLHPEE